MPSLNFTAKDYIQIAEKHIQEALEKEYMKTVTGAHTPPTLAEPHIRTPMQALTPKEFVERILGPSHRFKVQTRIESWEGSIPDVLHIALLDLNNKEIVRFEEAPDKFPSDALIDKLRLLR